MNWHQKTINIYNTHAKEMSDYYMDVGPRIDDIEKAIELAGTGTHSKILELGCGDGRDAEQIIKRAPDYTGIDPSSSFLKLARKRNPHGTFILSDAISYDFPNDLDIIFAFASLLHINQADVAKVFEKALQSLKIGGIFYISLKERQNYTEEPQSDQYGERMFYYYTIPTIEKLAGPLFEQVYSHRKTIGSTDWFTLALRKL